MELASLGAAARSMDQLYALAAEVRDRGKGGVVSFSPKVFIPLTRLCRDFCGYCIFRQDPHQAERLYMSPEEVLAVARAGEKAGCREALFVLGERPEQRYPEARRWLRQNSYDSTVEYLAEMCGLVLRETALYPHSNPGILSRSELSALKDVNASMGLMLESTSHRLVQTWRRSSSCSEQATRCATAYSVQRGRVENPIYYRAARRDWRER